MGKTSSPASVFKNANEAANRNKRQQERLQRKIQKAKHRFVWWAGIFFAWFPAVVILILALLVDNVEKNLETINNYKNFLHNFFTDGSFLWLSITLLGTSLLELILFGFKKYIGWYYANNTTMKLTDAITEAVEYIKTVFDVVTGKCSISVLDNLLENINMQGALVIPMEQKKANAKK